MNNLYALLVGVDRYLAVDVPELRGCVNDVDDVLALLQTRVAVGTQLHAVVLRDEQATVAAVVGALRSHLTLAGPGDTALFWFSGHGSQAEVPPWAGWFEETTGFLQTMVLVDSRTGDVGDLWDKELSVLLDAIAERAGHVCLVVDSCHAQGVNREVDSRVRAVRAAPDRTRDAVLPEVTARQGDAPEHVALFACGSDEEAVERSPDGRPHGLFTWALLRAMAALGTTATYRDLLIRTRAEVLGRRAYRQVPQVYPAGSELIDQPFLGGAVTRPPALVVMSYDPRTGWQIDAGSAHGLPSVVAGLRVGVPGPRPVREAEVVTVLTERSLVRPAGGWEPPRDQQFRVVLTGVPSPPTAVGVTGDPGPAEELRAAMGPSLYVRPARAGETADLGARLGASGVEITDRRGDHLAAGPPDAPAAVAALEHLARWQQIRGLGNTLTGLRDPVLIDLVAAGPGVERSPETGPALSLSADGAYHLAYERTPDGWRPPEIFIRLHNTSDVELYCVLLDLTGRFGIHAGLFPGAAIGPGRRAAAMRGRRIAVSLPAAVVPRPGCLVTDWLVLVVAEKRFAAEPFELPPLGGRIRELGRGLAFDGLLERIGSHTAHREMGAADAGAAYDWTTNAVRVVTGVPDPLTKNKV